MEVNKRLVGDINEKDLISNTICGCCGNKLIEYDDYRPEMSIHFMICNKCKAVTYSKIASQEYLDAMYSNYSAAYNWYNEGEDTAITFSEPERMAKHIFGFLEKRISPKNEYSILDFGGGSGVMGFKLAELFLKANKCKCAKVVVVDYLDNLYCTSNSLITMCRVFPIQKLEEKSFDVVIASAIIEHLPKPQDDIKTLFSVLKSEGYLYCRMPYAYPLFKLLRKMKIQFDMLYPGHIWDFSPEWYHNIIEYLEEKDQISIIVSRPSIPETTFKQHFLRALITYSFKAPWFLWHGWPYVGGWEAIYYKA